MKKTALISLGIFLMAGTTLSAGYRVGVKGSYFSSENSIFRDIYGGAAKFGLEGGLDISPSFSIWAGLATVHKTGKLTITEDETRVWITPLTVGVRYEIPAGEKFRFHAGLGIQEIFFKEESSPGSVKENALGLIATGGAVYRLTEKIGAGLFLSWSTCKMKNADVEFKVGGLEAGVTVEFRF